MAALVRKRTDRQSATHRRVQSAETGQVRTYRTTESLHLGLSLPTRRKGPTAGNVGPRCNSWAAATQVYVMGHTLRNKKSVCASLASIVLACSYAHASKCLGTAEIYFPPESALITTDEVKRIDSLLGKMGEEKISLVIAYGHADQSEKPRSGAKALSLARAAKVAILIMERRPDLRHATVFDGDGGEQSARWAAPNNRRVSLEISCVANDSGHYSFAP